MIKNLTLIYLVLLSLGLSGCFVAENSFTGIPPGPWRAVLKVAKPHAVSALSMKRNRSGDLPKKESIKKGELPFVFEVIYENENDFYIEILNGEERIPIKDIQFGKEKHTGKDTILINFPVYDSYIKGYYADGAIEGHWVATNRGNYAIPFTAVFGKNHRFTTLENEPALDVAGKWAVTFDLDEKEPYPAIGEFEQEGNKVTGTFLTETGDYRFLEGTIQGDELFLSCFDGAHAFLFEAKILEDNSLLGTFRSGKHYQTTWSAVKNPDFVLGDPDTLTRLVGDHETVHFEFENPDGKLISLENEAYQGKAKIVQILGTWCPNCRDETRFLVDYLNNNQVDDLAVIALSFEKYREAEKANAAINRYKEHFGMNYEMVYAGYYDKKEAVKSLPMLNRILSYPTLIFLDKNNKVRRIHTGFSGPATSIYNDFVVDFESTVQELINEVN